MRVFVSILIFSLLFASGAFSQSSLTRYQIGNTPCSVEFYSSPEPANISYSPDSSRVFTMESTDPEGITSSLIMVDLAQELSGEDIQGTLTSYLDFLKTQLEIVHSEGYTSGIILQAHPSALCLRDNWSDTKSRIAVMGCSNGRFIFVLLVFGDTWKAVSEKKEAFFQSLRFPGE